ncbi:hypothetical protein F4604DRAFT_1499697, partial [Suillus subluteus]
ASRLYRILISESAHLIWVLRCERTIGGRNYPLNTIESRWMNKITSRLEIDRSIASRIDKKNKTRNIVKTTWSDIITSKNQIPENWVSNPEVLVG